MEIWIAAGDETGNWDIVNGSFGTEFTGLAWVLGPLPVWEKALQMQIGSYRAMEVFAQPFATRLPEGVQLPENSAKYHIKDVWSYCSKKRINDDVVLDVTQTDSVLELLRKDAEWLLQKSGLGVLVTGGTAADGKAAGLGLSGDGLRERARAFAGLMTLAIPFLPGDASLNLLAEGRTEVAIAEAAKYNLFSEYATDTRLFEPYRNFIGHLTEDLNRASSRCEGLVAEGNVVRNFSCKGRKSMQTFIETLRGVPFMKANSVEVVAAMKGIADLSAALISKPNSGGCSLIVPDNYSDNFWSGNFRELSHAIHG